MFAISSNVVLLFSKACGNKVDPVYEALRFGTSLAQKAKRPSGSESPQRNSTNDLDNVPEEVVAHSSRQELSRKHSDDVFTVIENGNEHYLQPERSPDDLPVRNTSILIFVHTVLQI
ncbi:SH3 and cysteine-rich domain-containing protein-like [Gymnodraco acuticeps]|uniref:SH3 and cysteine-rich domain-containing protein-like n=1 Tax=Gymnodraco acuticeps TaxID=8218 RepID=A0A6P8WC04_GYMAC|nr:SH3 and cysteine-rich domain-containing protein-like [Gymnodraco acuticeps]